MRNGHSFAIRFFKVCCMLCALKFLSVSESIKLSSLVKILKKIVYERECERETKKVQIKNEIIKLPIHREIMHSYFVHFCCFHSFFVEQFKLFYNKVSRKIPLNHICSRWSECLWALACIKTINSINISIYRLYDINRQVKHIRYARARQMHAVCVYMQAPMESLIECGIIDWNDHF